MAPGKSLDTTSLDSTAGIDLRQLRQRADGTYVLKLPKRHDADAVKAITDKLAARGDVVSVEPDAMMEPLAIPTDSSWSQQWDMFDPATGSYGINLLPAWDITTGSSAITIGVIDTGYRPHIDLAGRFTAGYDFINDALVANDGNGRDSDPSDPGDWVTSAESASGYFAGCGASNSSWHGTHVAGTIGAVANNVTGLSGNVVGINQVSKIQPLRVLGKCGGYTSDIADAIRWAAGLTVTGVPTNPTPDRVVNISLGGTGACDSTTQSAITAAVNAGTVVVVAAGNSNANAANFTPANCNGVVTVAATGSTGKRAYYSNYGTSVEIAAPGGDAQIGPTILSTLNAGAQGPGADSYANYQGTSMATPHVVGVVSLMLSAKPTLTPAQVTTMLQSTATKFPAGSTCTTSTCGAGIVNAAGSSRRCERRRWRRVARAGRLQQDCARQPRLDRRNLDDADLGHEHECCDLRLLRRHGEQRCVRYLVGLHVDRYLGISLRAYRGCHLLLAGAGHKCDGNDDRERRFLVDVLDAGSVAPAGRVLEELACERCVEPEAVTVAHMGEKHRRDLVRVVSLDDAGTLRDVEIDDSTLRLDREPRAEGDVLLAGAGEERSRDDRGKRPLGVLELHDAVGRDGRTGGRLQPVAGCTPIVLVPVPGEVHVVLGVSASTIRPSPSRSPGTPPQQPASPSRAACSRGACR